MNEIRTEESPVLTTEDRVAIGSIAVAGNVEGDIIVGNHNFKVNTNYGTIVYTQAAPRIRLHEIAPRPPRPPRGFVNRVDELARNEQAVGARDTVGLFGPDGVGKTALLNQSANGRAASSMPNGVVRLEAIDERGTALGFEDVLQRAFDRLFESETTVKLNTQIAETHLGQVRSLLILDGFDFTAQELARLPNVFRNSALLVALPRPPLGDAAQPMKVEALPRAEAMVLLAERAGVAVDDSNRATLDAVSALLSDAPLAIVTAAGVIREKNLSIDRARAMLTAVRPAASESVAAGVERAFALAYTALSKEEQHALGAAAHAPGATVDAHWLRDVMGIAAPADQVIARLQAMGLLHANSPRLRIDPGIRPLARRATDETAVKDRLISYLRNALQHRALDWGFCADELGNILGGIDWAASRGRWADVIALGRAIDPYLTLHGLWDAWRRVLALVLAAALALGNSAVEAWARHQLGTHAIGAGQTSEAVRFLREALDMRRRQGDVVGAAYTQHNLDLLIPPIPPESGQPDGQPISPGPSFGRGIVLGMIAGTIAMGLFFVVALLISDSGGAKTPTATLSIQVVTDTPTPSPTPMPSTCQHPDGWVDYVVALGEDLMAVADKFGTPMIGLIIANCLSGPELTPGQILAVPPVTPTPTATNTPTATATPSHTPTPCGPPAGWLVYFIQAQDTLFSLARNTGTTLQQLKLANCLAADTIYVGQVLYVPRLPPTRTFTPSPTPTPTSTPTDTSTPTVTPSPTCAPPPQGWVTYVVQKGDTLPSLAQSLHTTEYMLRLANCLQSDILIPGQLLYVPRLPAGGTTPPPRITGIRIIAYSAKPEQSYYGSGTALICPTAIVAFRVTIDHPENAAEVTIVYRYEAAGAYEPWRTARAARDSGDVFSARIDNNANDQARQALDNQDGRIRWYVRAVDRDGVQYDTSDVETPLKYCDDSGF